MPTLTNTTITAKQLGPGSLVSFTADANPAAGDYFDVEVFDTSQAGSPNIAGAVVFVTAALSGIRTFNVPLCTVMNEPAHSFVGVQGDTFEGNEGDSLRVDIDWFRGGVSIASDSDIGFTWHAAAGRSNLARALSQLANTSSIDSRLDQILAAVYRDFPPNL